MENTLYLCKMSGQSDLESSSFVKHRMVINNKKSSFKPITGSSVWQRCKIRITSPIKMTTHIKQESKPSIQNSSFIMKQCLKFLIFCLEPSGFSEINLLSRMSDEYSKRILNSKKFKCTDWLTLKNCTK